MTKLKWLTSWGGQSLSSLWLPLVLSSLLLLTGCGGSPLSFLTGGGPNVAANVQAGAENNQAAVQIRTDNTPKVTVRPKARVDNIDQSNTTNNELPMWLWVVLIVTFIVGWVTDTPATYMRRLWPKRKTRD